MQGTNPRAARIAALIQRVIASNMESTLHDKRLKNVTITDVKVTNDLQLAKVYWTTISHTGNDEGERKRAQTALNQARGRLRTMVGAKAGLRLTPQLQFIFDEVPGEAHEIDDIIVAARRRDEELARMRANAQYAGVTNDLQLAKVYWTTISHTGNDEGERKRAQTALNQARGRLRTMVGAKAGLRLTPQLQFIFDEVPGEAHEIDDIIVAARRRDEELARMRANAQYAGEADPYKHDDEDETEDKIERLKHEDKDEYNEYDGDVVTRMRANAQYAGEADPYKHDDEDETEDKIERLKHEDKDEYNEYDGDVVTVEELEDFDDDKDAVDGSDDDPVDPAELDPQSTIDGAQD